MRKRSRDGAPPSPWSAKEYARRRRANKVAKRSRKVNR